MILELARRWQIVPQLGAGGFGHVFAADENDGTAAVATFVPKVPGAERELLFVQLGNVRNVVPVIGRPSLGVGFDEFSTRETSRLP